MHTRNFFLLIVFLLSFYSSSAQNWRIGLQSGVSYTSYWSQSPAMSPAFEINIGRYVGERLYIQGGIRHAEAKYRFELLFGDAFLPNGDRSVVIGTLADRIIQLPLSVRYKILGNKLAWKAGLGVVPDMIYLTKMTTSGRLNASKTSQSEFGLALSLHLLDLEYKLSEATSVGLDFDYQYYLISPYFPQESHSRNTAFLTLSHRLSKK